MYHYWLGIAAGIIALGVATLMGFTIIHGEELVMNRRNWELSRILVPSIVSIIGWLVTIWWALRQVEISAQRNRNLQHEMLQSNEKIKVIDSVVIAYMEMNKSLHKINSLVETLKVNIDFKDEGKSNPDLVDIFHSCGEAYNEMYENKEILFFNLVRLRALKINSEETITFLVNIDEHFAGPSSVWVEYQIQAAEYLQDEGSDDSKLFSTIDTISANCLNLRKEALAVVNVLGNT